MNFLAKPVSILHLSDLHILPHSHDKLLGVATEDYFKQVLAHAFTHHAAFDLILVTGDLAQDPCMASYQRILAILKTYHTKTVCLAGNHDDWKLMQTVFNQDGVNCEKQILFDNWQLIQLNSQKLTDPAGFLAASELDFLAACLEKYPNYHSLIAVHHHCIPSESAWLDTMIIANHEELFQRLQPYPHVKILLNGHIHQCFSAQKQGIQILGTPSTCFQFKPHCKEFTLDNIAPAYRVLKLFANGKFETQIHRLPVDLNELHTDSGGY